MSARLLWVGTVPYSEPPARLAELPVEQPRRGNIYDTQGVLLATSLKVYSLFADPKTIMDKKEAVDKLYAVLPEVEKEKWAERLNSSKRFVWLQRHLTPEQAHRVNALGIPGLGFREELVRLYPQGNLMSHVLGAVDVDGRGIAGLEGGYNEVLSRGEDIHLTLNAMIQQQLRLTLLEAFKESGAKSASAVAMDPQTGAIQAMVSLPDYNPNHFSDATPFSRFNRATKALYEMGSTFKIFTVANAFEQKKFDLESQIDCRESIKIGKYRIHDFHAKNKMLSTREVVMYSSNVGAAQIGDALGGEVMEAFFDALYLTKTLSPGVVEVAQPLLPTRWGRTQTMTISFGHGIAVTPLHVVSGVSALVSDGVFKMPYLVKDSEPKYSARVVSESTVEKVRDVMYAVVIGGSGRSSKVEGYKIGGKTGTAEKAADGGYDKALNVASFVGAVPLENPKMVALIMVEDGEEGYAMGGQVAAPAFGRFAQRALPLLGIWPKPEGRENNLE